MVKRQLGRKKKEKKVYSKRLRSDWPAAPTESFRWFKDYVRTEIDEKKVAKVLKDYVKSAVSKAEAKELLTAPDWLFQKYHHVAAAIQWESMGFDLPQDWNKTTATQRYLNDLRHYVEKEKAKEEAKSQKEFVGYKPSPAEIVKRRSSEFIANVEGVLDEFFDGTYLDVENYSPYAELEKIDAPYNVAKATYDYYLPILEEAELIAGISKKTPRDLEEAYSHRNAKWRKTYHALLKVIVDDVESYMLAKKAVRKKRTVKKTKKADKQVSSLKYLTESTEYKVKSVDPLSVVGAVRLFTFNAKNRELTEYVSETDKGFEVSGSTLKGVDLENSRKTRLRKPEEFLSVVLKMTPKQIDVRWGKLTTKTGQPNARINKDTVLLRVMER